jgi:hypothetical protein
MILSNDSVLQAVPYIGKSLRLENTQGSRQSRMPGSNSETRGKFCDGLGSSIVVQSHYYLSWPNYCKGVLGRLGNRAHPMIQTLFPNNDAVFQDYNAPVTQWELFSHSLKSMKVNFGIFPGQHNHQI